MNLTNGCRFVKLFAIKILLFSISEHVTITFVKVLCAFFIKVFLRQTFMLYVIMHAMKACLTFFNKVLSHTKELTGYKAMNP